MEGFNWKRRTNQKQYCNRSTLRAITDGEDKFKRYNLCITPMIIKYFFIVNSLINSMRYFLKVPYILTALISLLLSVVLIMSLRDFFTVVQ